jgi:hypothetical protein
MPTQIFRQGANETKLIKAQGPTTRTDGSVLPKEDIAGFERYLSFDGGPEIMMTVKFVEDDVTPEYDGYFDEVIDIDSQEPGSYAYYYKTVTTPETGGLVSEPSEVMILEILPPFAAPVPPYDLQVV